MASRAQRYMDKFYKPGEKVFFLDENKKWQGPGVTGESENQSVWIKWHGNIRKVNRMHLRPYDTEEDTEEINENNVDETEESESDEESSDQADLTDKVKEIVQTTESLEGNERFEKIPKRGREISFK